METLTRSHLSANHPATNIRCGLHLAHHLEEAIHSRAGDSLCKVGLEMGAYLLNSRDGSNFCGLPVRKVVDRRCRFYCLQTPGLIPCVHCVNHIFIISSTFDPSHTYFSVSLIILYPYCFSQVTTRESLHDHPISCLSYSVLLWTSFLSDKTLLPG